MSKRNIEDGLSQESFLSLAFHTSPIGRALLALDDTWLCANEAFLKLFSLSKEELSGMSLQQVLRTNASGGDMLK
jgi:PAS domain S-box-containing protein